jgi:hypothetical protein
MRPGQASTVLPPELRYQLDVLASNAAEVVSCAGGWLVDRVLAGWDVTVLVPECVDVRPLQILGAQTLDLEATFVAAARRPTALAVAVDLYAYDTRVRSTVRQARDSSFTEVRLWGQTWPAELNHGVAPVQHQLSLAARAFKAHALAAAAAPTNGVDPVETFRTATPSRCLFTADFTFTG